MHDIDVYLFYRKPLLALFPSINNNSLPNVTEKKKINILANSLQNKPYFIAKRFVNKKTPLAYLPEKGKIKIDIWKIIFLRKFRSRDEKPPKSRIFENDLWHVEDDSEHSLKN